jgi:hypothetical protein
LVRQQLVQHLKFFLKKCPISILFAASVSRIVFGNKPAPVLLNGQVFESEVIMHRVSPTCENSGW